MYLTAIGAKPMKQAARRSITRAIFGFCSCGLVTTAAATWMTGQGLPAAFGLLFAAIACGAMMLRD